MSDEHNTWLYDTRV